MRPYIHVYPEIPTTATREVWHANKWRYEMDLDLLSPMFDAGHGRHFYVNELAQLRNEQYVIPFRWVTRDGEVYADAWSVSFDSEVRQDMI